MIQHPKPISSAKEIAQLAKTVENEPILAFDTEFIRERTFFPQLEIIQLATRRESWLIDAPEVLRSNHQGVSSAFGPLLDVLQNPKILKVAHAAFGDQECLHSSFRIVARPVLDTSIAASLCGYGDSVGLKTLLQSMLNVEVKKGQARAHWSLRPLPPHLIEYAHSDVIHLVELGERMLVELDRRGRREWALSLSRQYEEEALYQPNPELIAKRLYKSGRVKPKHYPVLLEVARWREKRIRELNVPRKWLMDDNVLLNLAVVRPKDFDQLKTFRGVPKKELLRQGDSILEAIRLGENSGEPLVRKFTPPSPARSQAVDLLRCFLTIMASRHDVALKYLIDTKRYNSLLTGSFQTSQELVDRGILTPQAAKLFGEELMNFLQGRSHLSLQDDKVVIVER